MKITIELNSENEMEKLSALLSAFNIDAIQVMKSAESQDNLIKGDKNLDPKSLFGIWASDPKSLENIRNESWHRKTSAK